jgi:hypothetical protein
VPGAAVGNAGLRYRIFFLIFWAICAGGVATGPTGMSRILSAVMCLTLAATWLLSPRLARRHQEGLAIIIGGIGLLSAFWYVGLSSGGSAVSGSVEHGRYYVISHGVATEVTKDVYYEVAALEMVLWVAWPNGLLLGLMLHEASKANLLAGSASPEQAGRNARRKRTSRPTTR